MATNYKQTDPAWALYPYAGETMAAAGCGPTAVADLLNVLPTETADWMEANGYAVNGSGTWQPGIVACLKAYGHDSAQLTDGSRAGRMEDSTFDAFKKDIQNGYCGILLMGGTRTGCRTDYWSYYGHYVAVVEYDQATDKYKVYDPAYHLRDGWHAWGDMAGNIKHVFTSSIRWKYRGEAVTTASVKKAPKVKAVKATPSQYKFKVKQISLGSTGIEVLLAQEILKARGLYTGKLDRSFGLKMYAAVKAYQKARKLKQDGVIGPDTWKDMLALKQDSDGYFLADQIQGKDNSAEVYLLKEILKARGFFRKGELNFTFDAALAAALKAYQDSRPKLKTDGVCGPATWADLIAL